MRNPAMRVDISKMKSSSFSANTIEQGMAAALWEHAFERRLGHGTSVPLPPPPAADKAARDLAKLIVSMNEGESLASMMKDDGGNDAGDFGYRLALTALGVRWQRTHGQPIAAWMLIPMFEVEFDGKDLVWEGSDDLRRNPIEDDIGIENPRRLAGDVGFKIGQRVQVKEGRGADLPVWKGTVVEIDERNDRVEGYVVKDARGRKHHVRGRFIYDEDYEFIENPRRQVTGSQEQLYPGDIVYVKDGRWNGTVVSMDDPGRTFGSTGYVVRDSKGRKHHVRGRDMIRDLEAMESFNPSRASPSNDWPRSEVQSLLFSVDHFTEHEAKAWAQKHGYRYGKVDTTEHYHRLRQYEPTGAPCRTMELPGTHPVVKAVVCAAENPRARDVKRRFYAPSGAVSMNAIDDAIDDAGGVDRFLGAASGAVSMNAIRDIVGEDECLQRLFMKRIRERA